jgi:hypothetical protein
LREREREREWDEKSKGERVWTVKSGKIWVLMRQEFCVENSKLTKPFQQSGKTSNFPVWA